MIYLTGAFRKSQLPRLRELGVGVMVQPGTKQYLAHISGMQWAADNGCFAKGETFSLDSFYRWLDGAPRDGCLFATAPDVFPDAEATLARSRPVLPELRARGYRAAYVLQNGAERTDIPWDDLDAVFIGATDEWKLGCEAAALVRQARERGKWAHMGRVNSERRLRYAQYIGCQSADGTFIAFRNRAKGDGANDVARWFQQGVLTWR